jgi:hypothetical protein
MPAALTQLPQRLAAVAEEDELAPGGGVAERRDDSGRQVGEVEDVLPVESAARQRVAGKGLESTHRAAGSFVFEDDVLLAGPALRDPDQQRIDGRAAGLRRGWLMKKVTA